MLASAGDGGQSFTYGFAYHGQLPGTATFAVQTNVAEGTKVNVYRFDTQAGGLTMIAPGVTVGAGGVVTYKNDTMSEYLITTNTIAGAKTSEMASRQDAAAAFQWWWIAVIALAALLLGGAGLILIRRRNRVMVKK
jgi:LPXTG-motif cell wall-anchored protein